MARERWRVARCTEHDKRQAATLSRLLATALDGLLRFQV